MTRSDSQSRIIDPDRFFLMAGLVDWQVVRRRYIESPRAQQIAAQRGLKKRARLLQLRWLLDPTMGYPTEPFRVWRRPAFPMQGVEDVFTPQVLNNTPFPFHVITWNDPKVFVRANFRVTGSNAAIYAFAGAPMASALVDWQGVGTGFRRVTFRGPSIQCLVITQNAELDSISGIGQENVATDPSWQLLEIVGLPTNDAWSGLFNLDQPQGFVTDLKSPEEAALDRFRRGAPFYGWEAEMEAGTSAPVWELADPGAMLETLRQGLMDPLQEMVASRPPEQHHTYALEQSLSVSGSGEPAHTRFHPMQTLLVGAATDPLTSLISGFGTAIEDSEEDIPRIEVSDRVFFDDDSRSDWDYMVTARYERGIDGRSDPIEYAAIIFAAGTALLPPVPTNLRAATDGNRADDDIDRPWRGIVRLTWDKVPELLPFQVGSYAAARKQQIPTGGVTPLMDKRPLDTALQPISATTSEEQESVGVQALDERYAIASTPATNTLRYGVAHQNLFGLWSRWSLVGHNISEPAVQHVPILSARLDVTPRTSGSVCPGTLVMELEWDWTVRSLRRIILVGRMYAQSKRNAPPANTTPLGRLQRSLGDGGGAPFVITFGGTAAGTVPVSGDPDYVSLNGDLSYLSVDGREIVPSPPTLQGPRRYRLTITGFNLDYGATGHIGLALWARGQEQRLPQRMGPWTVNPYVVSASDPRPPVLNVQQENVLLTSLADAHGEHHAHLTWGSVPGAVGYFIYTTTETKLRVDRGMADPSPSLTLSERLLALRDAFESDPARRSFTRINDQPLDATESPIVIPRGSKEIHLYLVLGLSAGQVESAWPDLGDPDRRQRFFAFAAPQIATPAPPTLEVRRVTDKGMMPPPFDADLRIQTRPGATVNRIDLHRVRVPAAALALDTMGPPVATITGSLAPWQVQPTVGSEPGVAQTLGTITGRDRPDGSWKQVFYRAVAWSGDDLSRGIYGGRSQPSPAQVVVIPPANPPDLGTLAYSLGEAVTEVVLTANSTVPIWETPLGPHRLKVDVRARHTDQSYSKVYQFPAVDSNKRLADNTLATVLESPPAAGKNGLWRSPIPNSEVTRYQIVIHRLALEDDLLVSVQMIDPLGRITEQTIDVPAGSLLPAPEILSPRLRTVGQGFIFSFETSVPMKPTSVGPYLLNVGFRADQILSPRPRLPGRTLPKRDVGKPMALYKIPRFQSTDEMFKRITSIAVRRDRTIRGITTLYIALRPTAGRLTVTLESPDGRVARHGRKIQGRRDRTLINRRPR